MFVVLHLRPDLTVALTCGPVAALPPDAQWTSAPIALRGGAVPDGAVAYVTSSVPPGPDAAGPFPPPARTYSAALLKSALQKCVRRSLAASAVRVARQLMGQDLSAFLRRFPVILLEDALMDALALQRAVWAMCAVAKGFHLTAALRDALLCDVYRVAACPFWDPVSCDDNGPGDVTDDEEGPVGPVEEPATAATWPAIVEGKEALTAAALVERLAHKRGPFSAEQSSALLAIAVRTAYGGMPGDAVWMAQLLVTWALRWEHHPAAWAALTDTLSVPEVAEAVRAALDAADPAHSPGLLKADELSAACDFHPFPWLARAVAQDTGLAPGAVRAALWWHASSPHPGKRLAYRPGNAVGPPAADPLPDHPASVAQRAATAADWDRVRPAWERLVLQQRLWQRPAKRRVSAAEPKASAEGTQPPSSGPLERLWAAASPLLSSGEGLLEGLSPEQQEVATLLQAGHSVFCTGSAGTGKSFLLHKVIASLPAASTFVTASTGVAAVNIGGSTLHSFAGIQQGAGPAEELLRLVRGNAAARQRWRDCRFLIIDEVSMVDAPLLTKLDAIARAVRGRPNSPFGGIQLLLTGDFFQLPPVARDGPADFCFKSQAWRDLRLRVVQLTRIFRQRDTEFVQILQEVRCARLSTETVARLQRRVGVVPAGDIVPTKLRALNREVDAENLANLHRLPGPLTTFHATDTGTDPHLRNLQNNCIAPAALQLKVGAQVMLLKNLDPVAGLVNGARGVVEGFAGGEGEGGFPVVRFRGGLTRPLPPAEWTVEVNRRVVARRCQVPLRLAWAVTIHKCQGMEIDAIEVAMAGMFEYGQAYVALSRATSLEGLSLVQFRPDRIRAHPDVVEFYERLGRDVAGPPHTPPPGVDADVFDQLPLDIQQEVQLTLAPSPPSRPP
eukprot:EG_transcript_2552